MKKILITLFCFISIAANAQQVTDTTKKNLGDTIKKDLLTAPDTVKRLHTKPWALVAPAAAITYGALTFGIHPLRRIDYFIQSETNKTNANFHSTAESYFQFAPVVIVYGLNLVGVSGKNTFVDRTALLALSAGILGVTAFGTKHLTHRLRPNGSDYLSFPSGHTANAFMGAEFLAQEFSNKSPVYTVIGYSFAVTTGVFRMYNRDHWFSDVVAGAGLGIISTKLSYLVYPYIRNALTHTGKNGKSVTILPTYQDGMGGFTFAMQL
ncbi:MAG: superfamily protein [Mucilaginibacter sp.]|nr:superfamily protein [Mucilaginibacter sp.]